MFVVVNTLQIVVDLWCCQLKQYEESGGQPSSTIQTDESWVSASVVDRKHNVVVSFTWCV